MSATGDILYNRSNWQRLSLQVQVKYSECSSFDGSYRNVLQERSYKLAIKSRTKSSVTLFYQPNFSKTDFASIIRVLISRPWWWTASRHTLMTTCHQNYWLSNTWKEINVYSSTFYCWFPFFNPLNAELNPICYLLALLRANHFLHVSRIRVKSLILRLLMLYIYIYIYIYIWH